MGHGRPITRMEVIPIDPCHIIPVTQPGVRRPQTQSLNMLHPRAGRIRTIN